MNAKESIVSFIEQNHSEFTAVSDYIWDCAELGLKEYKSAKILIETAEGHGFKTKSGLAGMPTAFVCEWGKGNPIIGILGEYDALPQLNQEAGKSYRAFISENGAGHGCMHNLLGTASMTAAIATQKYMQDNNIKGTIRFYGCPGEEHGCGKVFMSRAGVFDDLDAALCWHPDDSTGVWATGNSALVLMEFEFKGKAAHAARCPHLGRSALDAAELMSVGANYLREHIPPNTKLHYGYKNAGNPAANIVQDYTCITYVVRGPKISDVNNVLERVIKIAKGAAMMTETEVEYHYREGTPEYRPNHTLCRVLNEALTEIGAPNFDEQDFETAKMYRDGMTHEMIMAKDTFFTGVSEEEAPEYFIDNVLNKRTIPYFEETSYVIPSSTDIGSVSYVVPTAQVVAACKTLCTPNHSWLTTAQGKSTIAHKGMLTAAKLLALGAVKIMEKDKAENGELLRKAREELMKKTGGKLISPFPDTVMPPLED